MGKLLVILGPTGVGKTALCLRLAEQWECPIVSADSRQIYRNIPIGTAAPTLEERQRVPHYFVGTHSLSEDYNAGQYERDCIKQLTQLHSQHQKDTPFAILTGGSMLYIDAICNGLDHLPPTDTQIRSLLQREYETKGLAWLQQEVQEADPDYWANVDQYNPQRLIHCLEICRTTGRRYSELRTHPTVSRPWKTIKIGLTRPRKQLYERINQRVETMIQNGLLEEVQRVSQWRDKNSLNTVGYKELFRYMDGELTLDEAVALIKQDSRHYAKRQMTWWRRDTEIHWIDAAQTFEEIKYNIDQLIS